MLERFTLITTDYEALCLQSNNEMSAGVYRHTSGNRNVILVFIEEILDFASVHRYRLLIGGDFNINMLDDNTHARDFYKRINLCGFQNDITTPTRVPLKGQSISDLFIVNIDISLRGWYNML